MAVNPLSPIAVLREAIRRVPAIKYAYGVAGVVAAAALITILVKDPGAAVTGFFAVFLGMVLIYIFSVLVISGTKSIKTAGEILVYTTIAFFVFIVCLSMSVLALSVPCNLAEAFKVKQNACSIPLQQAAQEPAPTPIPATGEAQNKAGVPSSQTVPTSEPGAEGTATVGATDTTEGGPSAPQPDNAERVTQATDDWFAIVGQFWVSPTGPNPPERVAKAAANVLQEAGKSDSVQIFRGLSGGKERNIVVIKASSKQEAESLAAFAAENKFDGAYPKKNPGWTKVAQCSPEGCSW